MSFPRSATLEAAVAPWEGCAIYLDHQATTPVDPRVLERMLPFFTDAFANAASHHAAGRTASAAVDEAREQIAALVRGRPSGVVFTSGATEANNLALHGLAEDSSDRRGIVTVATEHPSVLEPVAALGAKGHKVTVLPVGPDGELNLDLLAESVDDETLVVSVMAANNEIGTLHPLAQVADVAHRVGALFHCDATQIVGKLPFDMTTVGVDLVSMSAHKLYGPKGSGVLLTTREVARRLSAQVLGGGHERGHRSGTLNVPGCVGFGAAASIAAAEMTQEAPRLERLALKLLARVTSVGDVMINGPTAPRLPGNLNVCVAGTIGDDLILRMPKVAVSTGSACSAASPRPSHVLLAIGRSYDEAVSALRLSVGRFTTEDDVDRAADVIVETVRRARSDSNPVAALEGRT